MPSTGVATEARFGFITMFQRISKKLFGGMVGVERPFWECVVCSAWPHTTKTVFRGGVSLLLSGCFTFGPSLSHKDTFPNAGGGAAVEVLVAGQGQPNFGPSDAVVCRRVLRGRRRSASRRTRLADTSATCWRPPANFRCLRKPPSHVGTCCAAVHGLKPVVAAAASDHVMIYDIGLNPPHPQSKVDYHRVR